MTASTMEGPLVVVIGATGAQGGSVIAHLIRSDQPYRIRAVTRDVNKPKAKELEKEGCEVVAADMQKREDLDKAFSGADIVFAVTNFWEHMSDTRELADGQRLVDAAKAAGTVKLFVWSGLESVRKGSKGMLREVKHFDTKADITDYALSSGLVVANVQPACYMSNSIFPPSSPSSGDWEFALPMLQNTEIPLLDTVADCGAYVRLAIERGGGRSLELLAVSEVKTMKEIVNEYNEVTGLNAQYRQLTPAQYLESNPGPIGVELLEMLQWFENFGYYGGKDVTPSRNAVLSLGSVELNSWKNYVQTHLKEETKKSA
ncbi:hypothetical protein JCM11251_001731 [Rhodosporidiobolus azoricus]